MAISPDYKEFVAELFEPFGTVTVRSMFGGGGIYYGDVMFGLISQEQIFLKVDDRNRADFEEAGTGPFVFRPKSGKEVAMSYFLMPEHLYDDPDELAVWARKAYDAAMKTQATKPKSAKTRSGAKRRAANTTKARAPKGRPRRKT